MSAKSIKESKVIPVFVVALILATAMISQAHFGFTGRSEESSATLTHVLGSQSDDPQPLAPGMIFTVTKTADTADGVCNSDCSLREAIIAANANVGADQISFNIGSGPQTLLPTSLLPTITDPVVLDATTQPGFSGTPIIEIDGTNAGEVTGLSINGGNTTVRGLVINGFRFTGLQMVTKGNNLIVGNYIGTNLAGTAAKSNTRNNGIGVSISSANNVIGGTTVADRNIVSGNKNSNGSSGIWIQSATATGNKIIGNYIGTDVTGTVPIPHGNNGVAILSGASGNTIGGLTLEANVIAGGALGIGVAFENASNNKAMRNLIGIGPQGTQLGIGIGIRFNGDSDNNVVGGANAGDGNVIAFTSQKAIWNTSFNSTGNSFLGNHIFDNAFGIDLGDHGVTANDPADADSGPNNLQNFPVITSATPNVGSSQIAGTLNSVAGQYRIELFSNLTCNAFGNGEGRIYLGSTTATLAGTDGSFNVTVPFDVSGKFLTATATDSVGNTSEFSQCFSVAGAGGTVLLSSPTYTVIESNTATVTVKRVGGAVGAVSVDYQMNDIDARGVHDYGLSNGTLTWVNGDSSDKLISIPTVQDAFDESNEKFNIQLKNPNGCQLSEPSTAVITITDDDPSPSLSISNVSKVEGHNGTTSFIFDVTLSAFSGQEVRFEYATAPGGSATLGVDYQPSFGMGTILIDDLKTTCTVLVNGDTEDEPNETFLVNLSNSVNSTIQVGQGTGTIINDDSVNPTTVQFSQASYNTQEDLGALTITVTRSGDTSSSSSVFYTTNDVAASQKGDFEYASGKLKFGPGETSKTFVVLVNEDMFVEGTEALNLTLSNPTGATLGQQSTANISIADDAPESFTNPIDAAQAFVYMNYHDFLNREPDAGGLAFWTNEITSCGGNAQCLEVKRTNVSAAFFLSIEFQETGYLVYKTYKAAYGNVPGTPVPVRLNEFFPDTQEIGNGVVVNQQGWQQVLGNNKNAFMSDFVQRSKFTQLYPTSLTPFQFVDQLFTTAGVLPSMSERDAAVSEFGNAANTSDLAARARVLRRVAENPTLSQQEFNRAFVLMQYFGYLRRNPNDAPEAALNFDGYNFWLNKLNQFNGNFANADMVKAFILSGEYRQRFGQ